MPGEGDFKPFHSGIVPRYQEIATFMRAAREQSGKEWRKLVIGAESNH